MLTAVLSAQHQTSFEQHRRYGPRQGGGSGADLDNRENRQASEQLKLLVDEPVEIFLSNIELCVSWPEVPLALQQLGCAPGYGCTEGQ